MDLCVHHHRFQRKVPIAGQVVGQVRPRPLFTEQPLQEGGGVRYRVVAAGAVDGQVTAAGRKKRCLDQGWQVVGVIDVQVGEQHRVQVGNLRAHPLEGLRSAGTEIDEKAGTIPLAQQVAAAGPPVGEFRATGAENDQIQVGAGAAGGQCPGRIGGWAGGDAVCGGGRGICVICGVGCPGCLGCVDGGRAVRGAACLGWCCQQQRQQHKAMGEGGRECAGVCAAMGESVHGVGDREDVRHGNGG